MDSQAEKQLFRSVGWTPVAAHQAHTQDLHDLPSFNDSEERSVSTHETITAGNESLLILDHPIAADHSTFASGFHGSTHVPDVCHAHMPTPLTRSERNVPHSAFEKNHIWSLLASVPTWLLPLPELSRGDNERHGRLFMPKDVHYINVGTCKARTTRAVHGVRYR